MGISREGLMGSNGSRTKWCKQNCIGQNGIGQNGADKIVWTKWYG